MVSRRGGAKNAKAHLVAASQVEGRDGGELPHKVQAHAGHLRRKKRHEGNKTCLGSRKNTAAACDHKTGLQSDEIRLGTHREICCHRVVQSIP